MRAKFVFESFKDYKKLKESLSYEQRLIIKDILSTNEGVGSWWNKFVSYGKKGLLTSLMIILIAFSAQAQNDNKTDDVIKTGIEMAQTIEDKQDVYNFIIGAVMSASEDWLEQGKMDERVVANEIIKHYLDLRNGKTPKQLSKEASNLLKVVYSINKEGKINKALANDFIETGESITSYNTTTVGFK